MDPRAQWNGYALQHISVPLLHKPQFPILPPERAKAAHPELVEGCGTHFLTFSKVKKQMFDARCGC
jgi:hypothetical protein